MAGGRLDDKVAIVTGGTSGIGAAIVRRFAEEGALQVVVGTPTDEEARRAEAARLGEGRAVFVGVDVTEPGAAARIVRAAMAAYGRLDALVNNAGVDYSGVHVLGSDLDVSRRVFEVNFFAPLALLQEAARAMVAGRPAARPPEPSSTSPRGRRWSASAAWPSTGPPRRPWSRSRALPLLSSPLRSGSTPWRPA